MRLPGIQDESVKCRIGIAVVVQIAVSVLVDEISLGIPFGLNAFRQVYHLPIGLLSLVLVVEPGHLDGHHGGVVAKGQGRRTIPQEMHFSGAVGDGEIYRKRIELDCMLTTFRAIREFTVIVQQRGLGILFQEAGAAEHRHIHARDITTIVQSLGGRGCRSAGNRKLHLHLLPFYRLRSTHLRCLLTDAGNQGQKYHAQKNCPFIPSHTHLPMQKLKAGHRNPILCRLPNTRNHKHSAHKPLTCQTWSSQNR